MSTASCPPSVRNRGRGVVWSRGSVPVPPPCRVVGSNRVRICDLLFIQYMWSKSWLLVPIFEVHPQTLTTLRLHQAQWSSGEEHLHLETNLLSRIHDPTLIQAKISEFPELPRLPTYLLAAIPALNHEMNWNVAIGLAPSFSGFENGNVQHEPDFHLKLISSDPHCKCLVESYMISPTSINALNSSKVHVLIIVYFNFQVKSLYSILITQNHQNHHSSLLPAHGTRSNSDKTSYRINNDMCMWRVCHPSGQKHQKTHVWFLQAW